MRNDTVRVEKRLQRKPGHVSFCTGSKHVSGVATETSLVMLMVLIIALLSLFVLTVLITAPLSLFALTVLISTPFSLFVLTVLITALLSFFMLTVLITTLLSLFVLTMLTVATFVQISPININFFYISFFMLTKLAKQG